MQVIGNFNGIGNIGNPTNSLTSFETTISRIIGVVTVSAGLWFIVQIFSGAFSWITSSGDKGHVEAARKKIEHAIIGLAIVVLAYLLIALVGAFLGFNVLDLYNLINRLAP